jgi:hypothetical protein
MNEVVYKPIYFIDPLNKEYKRFADLNTKRNAQIVNQVDGLILYTNKKCSGLLFDDVMEIKISAKEFLEKFNITKVKQEIINKVTTKLTLEKIIDRPALQSCIAYINREDPKLDVYAINAVIAHCLQEVYVAEKSIALEKYANLTQVINLLKNDEFKKLPTGFADAISHSQFLDFMKRNFKVYHKMALDVSKAQISKDFH